MFSGCKITIFVSKYQPAWQIFGALIYNKPSRIIARGYIKILSARINRKSSNSISSEIKSEDSLSMVGNYTPNTIFASMLSFLLMSLATFNVGSLLPVR